MQNQAVKNPLAIALATQQEQIEMVKALAKPGEDIVASMTPEKAHLLHMAVGVMGEAVEFICAQSHENAVEELGDLEFYITGFILGLGLSYEDLPQEVTDTQVMSLIPAAGELLNITKKYVIYGKDLSTDELAKALCGVIDAMNEVYPACCQMGPFTSRELAVRGNIEKLLKGKNARYASGSYSDEQAQTRADKVEEDGVSATAE